MRTQTAIQARVSGGKARHWGWSLRFCAETAADKPGAPPQGSDWAGQEEEVKLRAPGEASLPPFLHRLLWRGARESIHNKFSIGFS